jgi:hypothetical protein
MSRWINKARLLALALLCAFAAAATGTRTAHAADPILMLLISLGRDMIEARERAGTRPPPEVEPEIVWPETYPGTLVTPGLVKRLIDDCFDYLSTSQRAELYAELNKVLLDPKNALVRAALIEHFAARAVSVRQARIELAKLSQREKQQLVAQFRDEVETLSDEERARFTEVVRSGMLPVPQDLNRMFLAALDAR